MSCWYRLGATTMHNETQRINETDRTTALLKRIKQLGDKSTQVLVFLSFAFVVIIALESQRHCGSSRELFEMGSTSLGIGRAIHPSRGASGKGCSGLCQEQSVVVRTYSLDQGRPSNCCCWANFIRCYVLYLCDLARWTLLSDLTPLKCTDDALPHSRVNRRDNTIMSILRNLFMNSAERRRKKLLTDMYSRVKKETEPLARALAGITFPIIQASKNCVVSLKKLHIIAGPTEYEELRQESLVFWECVSFYVYTMLKLALRKMTEAQ